MSTFVFSLLAISASCVFAHGTPGVVALQLSTIDKVVTGHAPVVLKVDKEHGQGPTEEVWKEFAKRVSAMGLSNPLLVAELGVPTSGEDQKPTENWAKQRFNAVPEDFPVFFGYKQGSTTPIRYDGAKTADELSRWVLEVCDVWIGGPGTVKVMEDLLKEYGTEDKSAILAKARAAVDLLKEAEKEDAMVYVRLMEKVLADGPKAVESETARTKKLAEGNKVTEKQKHMFLKRLNVLAGFKALFKSEL